MFAGTIPTNNFIGKSSKYTPATFSFAQSNDTTHFSGLKQPPDHRTTQAGAGILNSSTEFSEREKAEQAKKADAKAKEHVTSGKQLQRDGDTKAYAARSKAIEEKYS